MTESEIILKLTDPEFIKFLNWQGIETVLEIKKGRLKNVLNPNLRGGSFSSEELFKINSLLNQLASSNLEPELLLTDNIFRKILNWTGIENMVGIKAIEYNSDTTIGIDKKDENGKKVYGKRFKDVLIHKYFGGKFTMEERFIINEIFRNFKEKFPPIK